MKTRLIPAVLVALIIGALLGIIGVRFADRMNAYVNVSVHVSQGRSIMQRIAEYREANGKAPDQNWFSSLGNLTKTNEGFRWIYLNPPITHSDGRELIILTATKDNSQYLCGFTDYGIVFADPQNQNRSNKNR